MNNSGRLFQLISDNASFLREATIELSTVGWKMPRGQHMYESCLFTGNDSEVIEAYKTMAEAIAGHQRLSAMYKLKD